MKHLALALTWVAESPENYKGYAKDDLIWIVHVDPNRHSAKVNYMFNMVTVGGLRKLPPGQEMRLNPIQDFLPEIQNRLEERWKKLVIQYVKSYGIKQKDFIKPFLNRFSEEDRLYLYFVTN